MSLIQRLFSDASDVDAAQANVDAARGRLTATIEEIHLRISPSNLMDEALTQVRTRTADLAESAGQVVRERPATVAAGVAGIGLLLAGKPLARLASRLLDKSHETPAPKRRSPRKRKTAQPASEG
jgi:ElaB/YqjD/DUF883 family membrane-anchored ribosome-binding protein